MIRDHWKQLSRILLAVAFYFGSGLALVGQDLPHYEVVDLGTLGGTVSEGFGVNRFSMVAGTSSTTNDNFVHAFLWVAGKMIDLHNLPGGSTSGAAGVNLFGQVAGESDNANTDPNAFLCFTPNECRAFLWQAGKMQDLGVLRKGHNSSAGWINNVGVVVGASETTTEIDPANGFPPVHATAWILGRAIDLGTLGGPVSLANSNNDIGQVTGISQFDQKINPNTGIPTFHAFLFDRSRMVDLSANGGLGGSQSEGISINNSQAIVGDADLGGDQSYHAFVWRNGTMRDLGTIGNDPFSSAGSINDSGEIVGWSGDGISIFRATVWSGNAGTDLNTLVSPLTDLYLLEATGVNARGEITGLGVSQSTGEVHAFLLLPQCNSNANTVVKNVDGSSPAVARAEVRVDRSQGFGRMLRARRLRSQIR